MTVWLSVFDRDTDCVSEDETLCHWVSFLLIVSMSCLFISCQLNTATHSVNKCVSDYVTLWRCVSVSMSVCVSYFVKMWYSDSESDSVTDFDSYSMSIWHCESDMDWLLDSVAMSVRVCFCEYLSVWMYVSGNLTQCIILSDRMLFWLCECESLCDWIGDWKRIVTMWHFMSDRVTECVSDSVTLSVWPGDWVLFWLCDCVTLSITNRVTKYVSDFKGVCQWLSENEAVSLADNFSSFLCDCVRRYVCISFCVRLELCDGVMLWLWVWQRNRVLLSWNDLDILCMSVSLNAYLTVWVYGCKTESQC